MSTIAGDHPIAQNVHDTVPDAVRVVAVRDGDRLVLDHAWDGIAASTAFHLHAYETVGEFWSPSDPGPWEHVGAGSAIWILDIEKEN